MAKGIESTGGIRRRGKRATKSDGHADADPDAVRTERILRERARALAEPPRQPPGETSTLDIVALRIGAAAYGLPDTFVREVSAAPKPVALPRAPVLLLGVCAVHGDLLPVFDLARLLGSPAATDSSGAFLVMIGHARPEFGLLADEVLPAKPMPAEAFHFDDSGLQGQIVKGVRADGMVVLDGQVLLNDSRLFL